MEEKKELPSPRWFERNVGKIWGVEKWVVNRDGYCGKFLIVKDGHRSSFHCHNYKRETFMVISGELELEIAYERRKRKFKMKPGEIIDIDPFVFHRFSARKGGVVILEISTEHFDWDVVRKEPSK